MQPAKQSVLAFGNEVYLRSVIADAAVCYLCSAGHADTSLYIRLTGTATNPAGAHEVVKAPPWFASNEQEDTTGTQHAATRTSHLGFEDSVFIICREPGFHETQQSNETITYGLQFCLVHKVSGLYVTVLPTQQATLDESSQQVKLLADPRVGSFFKFLPRYRIHYDGDPVWIGDEVKITVFDRPLYLHHTQYGSALDDTAIQDLPVLEVNGRTSEPSVFQVFLYNEEPPGSKTEVGTHRLLQLGEPLVFFHRQKMSLLFSNDTTKEIDGSQDSADVVPILEKYSAFSDELSISRDAAIPCGALWMLEGYDPQMGSQPKTNGLYRLRQVVTNRYLVVVPSHTNLHSSVELPSNEEGWSLEQFLRNREATQFGQRDHHSTVPEVHQVVLQSSPVSETEDVHALFFMRHKTALDDNVSVTSNDLIRLQHAYTGLWLGTTAQEAEEKELYNFKLHLRPATHDAFTMVMASSQVRADVRFVAHHQQVVRRFVSCFHGAASRVTSPRSNSNIVLKGLRRTIASVEQSLGDLVVFCSKSDETDPFVRSGLPIVHHQQMLFDLEFHRLVFAAIVAPFVKDPFAIPSLPLSGGVCLFEGLSEKMKTDDLWASIHRIIRLCYCCLRVMIVGAPTFGVRLSPFIPLMQYQTENRLRITDTLLVMFTNNNLLQPEFCEATIKHYVQACSQKWSAHYLRFLSVMCTANGEGLVENQVKICQELLLLHPELLVQTFLSDTGELMVVIPSPGAVEDKSRVTFSLEEFFTMDQFGGTTNDARVKYTQFFVCQIELLSQLCVGERAPAICAAAIQKLFPVRHAKAFCGSLSKTPGVGVPCPLDLLLSHFLTLVINLHANEMLIEQKAHFGEGILVAPGSRLKSLSHTKCAGFIEELKEASFHVLEKNSYVVVEQTDRSCLLRSIADFWKMIIRRRQYEQVEIKRLLPLILNILDGKLDILSTKKSRVAKEWNRFEETQENLLAMNTKESFCQVLSCLLENGIHHAAENIAELTHTACFNFHQGNRKSDDLISSILTEIAQQSSGVASHLSIRHLCPMMFELLKYDSVSLAEVAMKLIYDIRNVTPRIASKAQEVAFLLIDSATIQRGSDELDELEDFPELADDIAESKHSQLSIEYFDGVRTILEEVDRVNALEVAKCQQFIVDGCDVILSCLRSGKMPERKIDDKLPFVLMKSNETLSSLSLSNLQAHSSAENSGAGARERELFVSEEIKCRGAVFQHWRIPAIMVRWLSHLEPGSRVFAKLLEVIFLFAHSSGEAALAFEPLVDLFFGTVKHFISQGEEERIERFYSISIIMQILDANKSKTGAVSRALLQRVFERIIFQSTQAKPDDYLLKSFNATTVGTHMAPANQKFVLESLHQNGAFRYISKASADMSSQQLAFNAALLVLIRNCCLGNSVTRHIAQRILPSQSILDILLSPKEFPEEHRSCYYGLLGSVYFVFDDESPPEREHCRLIWTQSPSFWTLMTEKALKRFGKVAVALGEKKKPDTLARTLVFSSIVPTLYRYFTRIFSVDVASRNDFVCKAVLEVGKATKELAKAIVESHLADFGGISTKELVPLSKFVPLLPSVLEDLDFHSWAKELEDLVPQINEGLLEVQTRELENTLSNSIVGEEGENTPQCVARLKRRFYQVARNELSVSFDGNSVNPAEIVTEHFLELVKDVKEETSETGSGVKKLFRDISKYSSNTQHRLIELAKSSVDRAGEENEEAAAEVQCALDEVGFALVSMQMTGSKVPYQLETAFRSMIAAAGGGNSAVQDKLYTYLSTHDEQLFMNLKELLRMSIMNVRRENQQWAQVELLGAAGDPQGSHLVSLSRDAKSAMHSLKHVNVVFHLLQQLCEGHHFSLQNYLRLQHDNFNSVNIVAEAVELMKEMTELIHKDNLGEIQRGFSLFTELCQGPCPLNQKCLLQNGICQLISRGLQCNRDDNPNVCEDDVTELQAAAATTLLSLTEGVTDNAIFLLISKELALTSVTQVVENLLSGVSIAWVKGTGTTCLTECSLDLLFNLLIFLIQLESHSSKDSTWMSLITATLEKANFLRGLLGCIEIQRGAALERLYFRIPNICLSLTEQSRQELLWEVDRSTRHSKLSGFMDKSDDLIFEMETASVFHAKMHSFVGVSAQPTSKVGKFSNNLWNRIGCWIVQPDTEYYEMAMIYLSLFLNALFIASSFTFEEASAAAVSESQSAFFIPSVTEQLHKLHPSPYSMVVWLFASCGVSFDLFVWVLSILQLLLCCGACFVDCSTHLKVYLYRVGKDRGEDDASASKSKFQKHWLTLRDSLGRFKTVLRFGYMFIALGAIIFSPLLVALHLFAVVDRSPLLKTVIIAITKNGRSLLLTLILGILVTYVFALFGITSFPVDYTPEDSQPGDENCTTLWRCFIFILANGLRQGGGIGDAMRSETWTEHNFGKRLLHDFIFFAAMNVIFMNILFGVIIDTFAELRDDKQSKEEDMATCCFICGLESDEFEQGGGPNFREHVKGEHNMWQYLYFLHHLRRKAESEYNGQESFVKERMEKAELHFFPNKRCLSLNANSEEPEDEERSDGSSTSSIEALLSSEAFTVQLARAVQQAIGHQTQNTETIMQQLLGQQEELMKIVKGTKKGKGGESGEREKNIMKVL